MAAKKTPLCLNFLMCQGCQKSIEARDDFYKLTWKKVQPIVTQTMEWIITGRPGENFKACGKIGYFSQHLFLCFLSQFNNQFPCTNYSNCHRISHQTGCVVPLFCGLGRVLMWWSIYDVGRGPARIPVHDFIAHVLLNPERREYVGLNAETFFQELLHT